MPSNKMIQVDDKDNVEQVISDINSVIQKDKTANRTIRADDQVEVQKDISYIKDAIERHRNLSAKFLDSKKMYLKNARNQTLKRDIRRENIKMAKSFDGEYKNQKRAIAKYQKILEQLEG